MDSNVVPPILVLHCLASLLVSGLFKTVDVGTLGMMNLPKVSTNFTRPSIDGSLREAARHQTSNTLVSAPSVFVLCLGALSESSGDQNRLVTRPLISCECDDTISSNVLFNYRLQSRLPSPTCSTRVWVP